MALCAVSIKKVIIMKKIISLICVILSICTSVNTIVFADVVYDENNTLLIYSDQYYGSDVMTVPNVSKQDAIDIAVTFIKDHCFEIADSISVESVSISHTKSYPYGYNITFPRIINGIVYRENNVSFFIDSKNGQIVSFIKNFDSNIQIEESTELIDIETAENIYKIAVGMNLQYNKKIVNNKIRTYLTYTADDVIINAATQNIIVTPYSIPKEGYFDVLNTAEKVSEYTDNGTVLSISDANSIIRNMSELEISHEYSISSVDYLKNHDDTHLISILYKNGNNTKKVTLNAQNGVLAEYTDSSVDIYTSVNNSEAVAEGFAAKYYADYSNQFLKKKSSDGQSTALLYERTVNGIPYKSNGLYIYCLNGKIKNISFAWDNTEFSPSDYIISADEAYEHFFDKCGLELTYYKRDKGILTPVYRKSSTGTGIFDAESGRHLNYDGTFYMNPKEINYGDINRHYAGNVAKKLSDCDIYVSSGNVYLDDKITQQEYLLLISEFIDGTKPVLNTTGVLSDDQAEMLYAYMYSNGIMERSEANYSGYITRADAVKYLLRILGHGTVGDMSEIFIPHFADAEQVPQNLIGYVELARSLGLINGSTDNRFKPNEHLTNGDSLIIIYNYLTKQG